MRANLLLKMEIQFSLVLTSLLFVFIIAKGCWSKIQDRKSKVAPGPWKLPLLGHLHHMIGRLPHHALRDLAQKHGPLMQLQFGQVPTIVVSSAGVAKQMMKTHDLSFASRPVLPVGNPYGCDGIVMAPYGEHWRQLKKICTLELLGAKRVESFWSLREEEVRNLIQEISLSKPGSPVNISEKVFSLANDITARAAFGRKCRQKETFIGMMPEIMKLAGAFEIALIFPSLAFLDGIISGTKLKLRKLYQKMEQILEEIINDHKVRKAREEEDLVDVLLRLEEENELHVPIEQKNIKAVITEIFIAGNDSTSKTVEWAFSEIVRNPKVMEKAQAEVRRVFGGKGQIHPSDMNQLHYLRLVIKETLRLHPPTPLLIPRECVESCELDGYKVVKGTRVLVNVWAIGRDPEYWRDAETFEPERFRDLAVDFKGSSFEYIPFGAGRRMCPGMTFAAPNIEYPLAQLLYHFDWKLPNHVKPEDLDMTELFAATVGRKSSLCLIPTPYRHL